MIKNFKTRRIMTNQEKVRDFMIAMEQEIPELAYEELPAKLVHFRNSLIRDEVAELEDTGLADVQNVARELADILYVVYGTALAYGLDLDQVFDLVHRANMKKTTGPVREDGKRLKPKGWEFPHWELYIEISQQQGVDWLANAGTNTKTGE